MEQSRNEAPDDEKADLPPKEEDAVEEREAASSRVIHEVIRRQGDEELDRPASSLFFSGMVAGVAMAASVLGRGLIESHLPDSEWRLAVSSIGYCLGFVIVVLGRLQLFTESTLSAVIPVAANPSFRNLGRLGRLWGLVLAANLAGTLLIATLATTGWVGTEASTKAMLDTSRSLLELTGWDAVRAAVPAGFLMAGIAWSLPGARRQEFFVLVFCTYFISLGEFAHVVAGAVEAWMLWLAGEASLGWVLGGFLAPALFGNILGGSVLFALLAHAQVHEEV
ncbi:formate/nitrite transporter family protein [Sphingomonas sp. HT-1]|uniref:formate/nitrite transporter family protein n=1 Tax=unclassified Sphingomonas TaxID=196159 RepID=UPI000300B22A|nr:MULTISPECIES: formate/nitrite transporter family protein [unclassified Sphingomonas]KTF67624.1 transporter (formate/nitrite transporter family protein) [Sphingomonas sp. WG]